MERPFRCQPPPWFVQKSTSSPCPRYIWNRFAQQSRISDGARWFCRRPPLKSGRGRDVLPGRANSREIHWKYIGNTSKITYGVSRAAHSAHHEIPGLTPQSKLRLVIMKNGMAQDIHLVCGVKSIIFLHESLPLPTCMTHLHQNAHTKMRWLIKKQLPLLKKIRAPTLTRWS